MKKQTKVLIISLSVVLFVLSLIGGFLLIQSLKNKGSDQLLNTTWKAIQFNGQEIQGNVLLNIEKDSVGFNICNNIGYGKIKITKDQIFFHSEASSTLMACDEPLMSLETEFINVFREPANYVIEDDNLILTIGRSKVVFISTKNANPSIDNGSSVNQQDANEIVFMTDHLTIPSNNDVILKKAEINDGTLKLKITYSGCDDPIFKLYVSPIVTDSIPPIISATIVREFSGDNCERLNEREVSFSTEPIFNKFNLTGVNFELNVVDSQRNNISVKSGDNNNQNDSEPSLPSSPGGECGIENCHGLDIVCGSNPVEACTMIYEFGDGCWQFAKCGEVNGKCQQVENSKFNICKECALKCKEDFQNNPDKMVTCESKCSE